MYFAQVRPFSEDINNNWEIFNEVSVMMVSYVLMWLTDDEMLPDDRDKIGWLYISICSFNLLVNGLKVAKKLTMETIPEIYGKYKIIMNKREFESKFQKWIEKKIKFAESN